MEALACHDESTSQRLGDAEIVDIVISDVEELEISANVKYAENDETGSISLPVSFVTAAMIRYCIDEGIPVPKRCRKEIKSGNGMLSLVMRLTKGTIADELDDDEEETEAA